MDWELRGYGGGQHGNKVGCGNRPSNVVDGQDNGAMTKDFAQRLPPMVERTASLYVVGRWGGGDTLADSW